MSTRKCLVSVGLVAIAVSSFIAAKNVSANSSVKFVNDSSIKGGECFANNMRGDFIDTNNNWCPVYDTTVSIYYTATPTHKSNKNRSVKTPIVLVVNTPGNTSVTKVPDFTKIPPTQVINTKIPNTPVPPVSTQECTSKNKNDDKKPNENPCDGNAGGGNG